MITGDYHIHTARCGHARGELKEYIDFALNNNLREIGFSDHAPMYWLPVEDRDPEIAMDESELGDYLSEILKLSAENSLLTIRLGIELDYIPGYEREARALIENLPFDYVIGSVHFIEDWPFDHPGYIEQYNFRDLDQVYRSYFELICQAAVSGIFDIIGHPDLIKKFGHQPKGELTALYSQAARAFALGGVCVEVNTSGLRWNSGEMYPSLNFLKACFKEGVPAIVGSDAHCPEQIGFAFDQAKELLQLAGYSEVAYFEKRQMKFASL
jgi:histidinol-phosphatase (PHP family)